MKLRKGTFLLLLTLLAALVMAPSAAAESYGLHVGGVEITSDNLTVSGGSGTATYDPDSHTLTLNNYSYSGTGYNGGGEGGGIDYRGGDLRIELVGSNSIVKSADSSPDRSHGIYFNGGTLTIGGEGSLDISFQETSSGIWKRNGIFCEPGAFVMESGTVTAAGGTADESAGIYTSSGITINGGTFTGIGNPTTNYESRGIYSGSITINAGTVTARATNGDDEAYAFHGGVTVNGGEVTASASSSGEAKAFSWDCDVAGELLEMKAGDSAETAVATTNPDDVSGKKYAYINTKPLPSYTATFDPNGGEGAMDAISALKGHQITLPANAFSAPTGKAFNGWLDGETAYQPGNGYTLAADVTFSAIWADAVTVTFDSNGGGAVDSQTIPINTSAVKPKAPARDGFIFRGWELDGTSYDFSAPVARDITLTASWIEGLSVAADFEDGAFPDGWTQEGNGSWSVGTGDYNDETGAHGGSRNAKITHSDSENETYLIMPAQDLSGKSAASLAFWYINRSWDGDIDAFGAYYRIDGGDWTELFATTEAHESWTEWSDALPDAALAANVQIGFKMTDNFGFGVGLDDVLLESGGHSWSYAAEGNAIAATCQNDPCAFGDSKSFALTLNIENTTEGNTADATLDGLEAFNAATGLTVSERDIQYYSGESLLSEAPSEAGSYTAKLTAQGVTASKAFQITGPVAYLDAAWNETTKTVDFTEKTCADYAVVASDSAAWGAGWYAVTEDVTIAERVTVAGEVYLILCDGATLTASKGITVDNDNKLTVYAQSGGTGALKATGTSDYDEAGIGAFNSYNGSSNCGTVAIHGGVIEAVSARGGAGIGGAGGNSGGGNITIYGGDITAVGNGMNTGIGSGWRPYGSTAVTIYGGEINATGGQRAAGIGGGTSAENITVNIYGGVINATGGATNGAGIGFGDAKGNPKGTLSIFGGDMTASGVVAIGSYSEGANSSLTVADSLSVKAGDDAASATDVTSSFAASHAQKYAHIFTAHTHDGDGIAFEPWNASDSLPATAGDYYLTADVTLSATWNVPDGEINLCLNGHGIIMANPTKGQGSVIKIDEGATLNLYDCDETTRYYYIGKAVRTYYGDTYHYLGELVETTDDSRYVNAARKGSFTGGYITGGNGSYTQSGRTVVQGGGVWVNGGVLNLYGGCIFGNYSSAASSQGNEGGGVEVFAGTFHMGGGYIIGNQGGNVGGGVDVNANGAFTMSGGEIRHNTASEGAWAFGGGVNGALTMTGGIISGNAALYSGLNGCGGGGINGTLIMSGGVIEGNSASNNGGGVSGSLTVSGDAQIINNWKAGSAGDATSADWAISDTNSNAYIANGQSVAVVGGLSESASVGVTMQTPGVFTSGLSGNGAASNFTSDDAAYSIKLNSGDEALLATPATLDTAPAAQSLTYNGAEQALVTAGAATGGAVQYKAGDSGAYSETVPTAKNAGTYTVYYKVVGDDTHTDTAEASVSVMIAPKEATLEWADTALTYNGAAQKPTATVSNLASGDSCDVTVTGEQTSAGTYIATATALDNANYTLPTTATKAFTIGKATLNVTAAAQSKTYGEDDPELTFTASGFVGDDTEDLLTGALSRETGENAGTYAVTQGTLSAGDNYAISFTGANLTIHKATLTVTAADKSKTYGEDDPELTFTASGFVGDDTQESVVSGALSRAEGESVGTYVIGQGTLSAGNNYAIDFTGANLTINKATLTVTAAAQSKTYGEADPELTFTASGFVGDDTQDLLTGALSRETGESAGTYAITQGTLSAGDNYAITLTGKLTINKATLTVTAAAKSKTYGEADPELTFTAFGFVGSDTESVINGALSRAEGESVGTYAIGQGTLSAGNYAISFTGANFTITPATAPFAITLSESGYVYDGAAKTPAVTVKRGDLTVPAAEYTVTYADNINAGTATVTLKDVDGGNFTVSGGMTFTIAPAGIAPSVTLDGWTYGETANAPSVTGNSGNGAVTYEYKLRGAEDEAYDSAIPVTAGNYTVRASIAATDNYAAGQAEANFTIAKATLTVTAKDGTIAYGDAPRGFGVTYSGFANGDGESVLSGTLSYDFDYAQYSDAGNYKITPSGLTASNYAIDFVNGALTVEPKTIELIWGETNFTYDGAEKLPAASAGGLLNGDECVVTVTGGQTNAGNYAATASGLSNNNYRLPENNTVSFSVHSASIDVSAVNYSGVYDGAPHSPTVTVNSPSGVSIKYRTEEGAYSLDECPALTNAGSLTIYYQAAAENYESVTGNATVTISKKPVTVSGITAANKPYDGNADATLNYDNVVFNGIVTGGKLTVTATGTFENSDVGKGKTVTITNLTLDGADAGNYQLAESGQQTKTTANITANTLNVTATGYSGAYDGKPHSITVTAPDGVSVTYSETESGTYGAENPAYANAGTYTVYYKATQVGADTVTGSATVAISKKPVTVSGITAANKLYDGNADATLNYDNVVFSGIVTGDELTITATGTFESAQVGGGKAVQITNLTLGGADVGNYQLAETGQQTETTANITANALNVTATGYSGTYDGQTHSITVTAPDGVSVTYSESENGAYSTKNPAYTDAGSYTVYYKAAQVGANTVTGSATVAISKKPVTVSGITAANKPYDGTTEATLNYDDAIFSSIITDDELTITATGTFESAEVGDGKTVRITGLTLGGTDAGNYQLAETGQQTETTANITANALNVTATGYSGTYDGQSHSITVTAPEGVSVTYSETESGTYGADNPVYTDAGSYTVYYKATQIGANDVTGSATVAISKKPVTVSGITVANKPYDGNADATLNYDNVVFSGIVTGGKLTVTATGTFESTEVGDGKTVRITGLTLGGADAGNYQLAETGQQTETTANITANALNVTATGYSGTYDGQSHSVTVTAPDGVFVTYSESENGAYSTENPAYADAGNYTVYYKAAQVGADTVTGSATVSIEKKTVSLIWGETSFIYDGAEKLPNVTASGLIDGDSCTVTVTGGQTDAGTYVATAESLSNDNYQLPAENTVSFTISEGTMEVVAEGYDGIYDGESHSIAVTAPDGASVAYSESAEGEYAPDNPAYRNAGSYTVYYKVELSGFSTVQGSETVHIAKREVTVSGIAAGSKPWDGNADAALIFANVAFDGLLDGDTLIVSATGEFEDAEIGSGKTVTIANLTLGGADAGNYQLAETGQQESARANITPNPLDVTPVGYSGVYDGEFHGVSVEAPDGASVTYGESEDGDYYAVSPEYADAGHYAVFYKVEMEGSEPVGGSVAVNIERKGIRVAGIAAENKPYDGNANATLNYDNVTFQGIITGDELTVTATGTFESADVGTGKTVSITDLTLGGFSAGNYQLSESGQQETATADISALTLDVSAEDWSGVYDGQPHSVTVTAPDGVSVTYSESENGTYGAENPAYADAGNYTVYYKATQVGAEDVTGSASVTISEKPVTVSGIMAENKPYDGNTNATLNYDSVTFSGIVTGDELTVTATGTFESADVGNGKAVRITVLTLGGADAGNYQLAETGQQTETTANITANALNVTATGYSGTYDGQSHSVTVTAPDGAIIAYSESENGAYSTKNPSYTDAGEYTVYYRVTQTGAEIVAGARSVVIEKQSVTVSGITAANKPYDGNADATLNYDNVTFSGIVTGDELTVTAIGAFESAEVGDEKTVTITNLTLGGADAGNYQLAETGQQTETTAKITANALNVTARGYSGTYDGKPHSITVTAPDGAIIAYGESENGAYSTENPAYTDAGSYTVYYKVVAENYEDVQGYETVSISRASVRVTLSLVDRADPSREKNSWPYGGVPAVPMLTVAFDGTAETLSVVLLGDGDVIRDYGMASYSYKLRNVREFIPSTPEEIAALPAGEYTMRVDIAESRNLPAASAGADFTIAKASHESVLAEAVTVSPGAKNASADLSAYLEDGFSCHVSAQSGNLIAGAATTDGSAVRFDVSDASGTLSGSIGVTVSSANYLDYTVTVPLITGSLFKVRFDSNGGNPVTETRTLSAGSVYGSLPVPVRDGWSFDGWHTAKTGGAQVTPETVCDSDATLFAHWTAVEYTVTLSLKGGDLPHDAENWTVSDSIGSATFRSDGGPFVLPEAVRDGYVFTGWTTENAPAKLKVSIPKGNTENLTYKANWTEGSRSAYASFTKDDGSGSGFLGIKDLTQDANRTSAQTGGTDSGVKSYIAAALQELSFDDDTPLAGNQRKDVSVSMTARVLSEDAAQEDETVTQEREEIADAAGELYGGDSTVKLDYLAIDIEKTVSVTTTEGDGTETVNPGAPEKVTESHRVIEIPLRYDLTGRYNPVVIRYHGGAASAFRRLAERPEEFGGLDGAYYVSGAGNDAVIYIYSSRFSSYAVTTSGRESYAVFFDTDGGTEIDAQIVYRDEGGHAERPQDPVKDGYQFNGWRVEKNGSRRDFDFDAEIINIDTILYADWQREQESEPEPVATPVYSGGSSGPSAPVLQEYVTANGYRGVYNGASRNIQVSAPKGTTVLYSREENGAYTVENPSFRDAGEYVVWYQVSGMGYPTVRDFETVEIQRREVTVSGIAAESKPYDGNAAATLNYNRVKFDGIVKGDELTITATGTFENEEIGDGKTVVITNLILGGGNAGNYRLADSGQQSETKANITENELNVTAAGYSGTYDGDAHSVSVDAPDGVSVLYAESENGIYSAENPAYVNADYYLVYYRVERDDGSTLMGSAAVNIARRPVTVSGIRAKDKPYDGSVSAELDYDNVSLDGIVTGDRLEIAAEGAFESAEVGDNKTVLISNLTLRGDNAGNYRLADSGQQTETKANITPNVLEVNAESYVGVYDREPHGIRVEAPEGATVTYSERESGPYSETIPAYRDAGEYAVYYRVEQYGYESVSGSATVTVYKRPVRVSGISAADKPYDGNINASLSFNNATLEGRISGDDIGVTAGGAFEDAQSGTDKTVFITGLSLRGADAGNYWIVLNESQSATRADITPNPLQVSVSGYSGVYDGKSHGVSVDAPDGVSVLYVESERGTYSATAPSYRNAGEYAVYYRAVKAGAPEVTGSVIISIEKREVAVSGITAADKPYDGNTNATLNYDNVTISGIVTGDKLTVTATGTFASPDAGKGKAVRITGLTLGGADAGNYRLAPRGQQTETQADITRKSYAVTGSIRHEDAEGNVTLELLDGNAVRDSASAMMMKGVGTYSFRHVPSGSYTLVVTRDDNGQKVTLSMPLRVGA